MTRPPHDPEHLESALWASQIGFWDLDVPTDRVRWWNDWCETMGFDPCTGPNHTKCWDARIHPEDLPNIRGYESLREGETDSYQIEFRLLSLRGTWHWIMNRGRAVSFGPNGEPTRIVGVTVDIDQRKRAELALRASEARLEVALSASHLGVWDLDIERNHVQWLNDWCQSVGIAEDRGPNDVREWNKNVHPEDLARAQAVTESCRKGFRLTYEIEYRYRDRKGEYLWLIERGRVVGRAPDGSATRIAGVCMDITARKVQEQSIATFRERYLAVAQIVPGFVFEMRPDTGPIATITWASDGIRNVFGCDLQEYLKRTWRSFWRIEDHARFAENLRILQTGRATQQEWRIRDIQGREKWLRAFYTPFTDHATGIVDTIIGVALDITDRVQLERRIIEAANLEQQRIARDLHDGLGQELTGISLSLTGIAAHLRAIAPSETRELEQVVALVDHAIVNTRDLAHGLAPLSAAPGALQHALRVLSRTSSRPKTLEIAVFTQATPVMVPVEHATHLYRIAQEALANAMRHANATRVEIRLTFDGQHGTLSIADNGRGPPAIPEPKLGMGLRTMAHRARMIDGEFSIEPRRRGGTRIVCKFQRSPAKREP